MSRPRYAVVARPGPAPFPCVVRSPEGALLELSVGEPPAEARWVGAYEGVAVWATPLEDAPEQVVGEDLTLDETPETIDEVGISVGPDRDNYGLFDSPTTGTVTGERTAGPASMAMDSVEGGPRRTAVLAWILADHPTAPAPAGTDAPCEPLKRLIADEPLDPLPALDGVPPPRPVPPARVAPPPEREDTATQIQGFDTPEPTAQALAPPAPRERLPLYLLLLALGAAIAAALIASL